MQFMTIDESDVLAAIAEGVSTHVDMRIRRSSPMPRNITDAIDRLLEEHSRLEWPPPVCGAIRV
jgi:hypothetical protein